MSIIIKHPREHSAWKASVYAVLLGALLLAIALIASGCTGENHPGHEGYAPEAAAGSESSDLDAIGELMHATWDTPDTPLEAGPIAIAGDYAVADWTQGPTGGRALLRKRDGAWAVILCAGDILTTGEGLIRVSVPVDEAHALAEELHALESNVPPERLQAMAQFLEIVEMEQ